MTLMIQYFNTIFNEGKMKTAIYSILLVGFLFLFAGCAGCPDCGSIRLENEITKIFTSETIVPGYQYFYYGEILYPKAILGIDKGYTVEGKFWTPIDLTQEQLNTWVQEISTRPTGIDPLTGGFNGYAIRDPQGNRVGIWYSRFDWGLFKFPGDKVIQAYPPSFSPGAGTFSRRADLE